MGWVVNATPRPLYPGKDPVPIVQEARVSPRAVLDGCGKSLPHRDSIPGLSLKIIIIIIIIFRRPQFFTEAPLSVRRKLRNPDALFYA
jgi:hypothetical protein